MASLSGGLSGCSLAGWHNGLAGWLRRPGTVWCPAWGMRPWNSMLTWRPRCETAFSWLQRPSVAYLMTRSCLKLIGRPWTLCARDQKRQLNSMPPECRRWQRKLSLASQALHCLRSWRLSIYLGDWQTTAWCMTSWHQAPHCGDCIGLDPMAWKLSQPPKEEGRSSSSHWCPNWCVCPASPWQGLCDWGKTE